MPKVYLPILDVHFICPFTRKLVINLLNPYALETTNGDMFLFEQTAIKEWLKDHDYEPRTGAQFLNNRLSNLTTAYLIVIKEKFKKLLHTNNICTPGEFFEAMQKNDINVINQIRYLGDYSDIKIDYSYFKNEIVKNCSPLHIAADQGALFAVNLLLNEMQMDASLVDGALNTPLHHAVSKGHLEIIKSLLEKRSNPYAKNEEGWLPLHMAVKTNKVAVIELFREGNVDPLTLVTSKGETLLHLSANYGNIAMVTFLLKLGAKPNVADHSGTTALHLAAKNGHRKIVELLTSRQGCPNAQDLDGWTPLHKVVNTQPSKFYIDIFNLLLKAGSKVNIKDNKNQTPLHIAAKQSNDVAVELLLVANSDIEGIDLHGQTPLHAAANGRNDGNFARTVKLLLEAGSNPNVKDNEGKLPLHFAAGRGRLESVQLLLNTSSIFKKSKVGLNVTDNEGKTPLYFAAGSGHKEIVELLLKMGANPDAADNEGSTPLQIAFDECYRGYDRYEKVIKLLVNSGKLKFKDVKKKDLVHGEIIGSGSYGAVYKGKWKDQEVAIKEFFLAKGLTEESAEITHFKEEVALMSLIQCDYIIKLYGARFEHPDYSLLMGYMPQGNLYQYLQSEEKEISKRREISWELRYEFIRGIAKGMDYLHERSIIHGDLKSQNILLDDKLGIKIADFGGAKIKITGTVTGPSVGGTTYWMAPELKNKTVAIDKNTTKDRPKNSKESDVYSFGVVMWEIATRKLVTLRKKEPEVPDNTQLEIKQLIEWCTETVATERPTMKEVVCILENKHTLHLAVKLGNADVVKKLLEELIEKQGDDNAVKKFLKEHPGANPNAVDKHGQTPLHAVATGLNGGNFTKVVELLLQAGSDPAIKDSQGRTALHLAGLKNRIEVMKLLKTDIDAIDNKEQTPLHLAVIAENIEAIKFLIEAGANINIADIHGKTALQIAMAKNNKEILFLFENKNHDNNNIPINYILRNTLLGSTKTFDHAEEKKEAEEIIGRQLHS